MSLTDSCGHHCGIKDGYEGHCPCRDCHWLARIPLTAEEEGHYGTPTGF